MNETTHSKGSASEPDIVTLERHVEMSASPGLGAVVGNLAFCARRISAKLRRARLEDVLGEAGEENVQGEPQQKLDVIANDIMMASLAGRDGVVLLGSEEDEDLVRTSISTGGTSGVSDEGTPRFAVFFDPLDGSSNLEVAGSVGTIFSIYRLGETGEQAERLASGRAQQAAGYFLYGSSTVLVLAAAERVAMFVLDPEIGAFVRVSDDIRIPASGKVYSVNEANLESFPEGVRAYIAACHAAGVSARYAGAMVADVHRVLLKGGVFLYPATAKAPGGKLRLMYECNPMAKVICDAGGLADTGRGPIQDVPPERLHQRVPVILGSPDNVREILDRM